MRKHQRFSVVYKSRNHLLGNIYARLLNQHGRQLWWPADTRFEVMVGAVLTQRTSWNNVEKALANLVTANVLFPAAIRDIPLPELTCLIYPSGYYNIKAQKLKALSEFLNNSYLDDINRMTEKPTMELRAELMDIHGIGNETADSILLYSLGHPVFVVDAYTHRLMLRLGVLSVDVGYSMLQEMFSESLPKSPTYFNEYHALIVRHSIVTCKAQPKCNQCCLKDICKTGLSGQYINP